MEEGRPGQGLLKETLRDNVRILGKE